MLPVVDSVGELPSKGCSATSVCLKSMEQCWKVMILESPHASSLLETQTSLLERSHLKLKRCIPTPKPWSLCLAISLCGLKATRPDQFRSTLPHQTFCMRLRRSPPSSRWLCRAKSLTAFAKQERGP